MSRFYVAAPFAARDLVVASAGYLQVVGHESTSTWALSTREINQSSLGASPDTDDEAVRRHAQDDLSDVYRADGLIMLTAQFCIDMGVDPEMRLHTGGRHTELGYALALEKPVAIVGEPENIFQRALCFQAPFFAEAVVALQLDIEGRQRKPRA